MLFFPIVEFEQQFPGMDLAAVLTIRAVTWTASEALWRKPRTNFPTA